MLAVDLLLLGGLVLYLLPILVAEGRDKRNVWAIFALNLFLGWTLVGWFVALVWAFTYDLAPQPPTPASSGPTR
jgi:T4 superinfection immunity protein